MEKRATKEKNPYSIELAAIVTGLDHYRENCVMCHGATDVAGAELSRGLNPPAPSLGNEVNDTPGERIRLRIIDGSATTFFYMQFAGGPLQVISADGQPVQPFDEERLLIGVAETYQI